jgi:hypothetical protein
VSAGLEEAAAPDQPSDELVYPKGFTLATVLVALCLAVFLVALVRRCALFPHFPVPARQSGHAGAGQPPAARDDSSRVREPRLTPPSRTTPSSQPPSRASPTSSRRSTMWAGTRRPIC